MSRPPAKGRRNRVTAVYELPDHQGSQEAKRRGRTAYRAFTGEKA